MHSSAGCVYVSVNVCQANAHKCKSGCVCFSKCASVCVSGDVYVVCVCVSIRARVNVLVCGEWRCMGKCVCRW